MNILRENKSEPQYTEKQSHLLNLISKYDTEQYNKGEKGILITFDYIRCFDLSWLRNRIKYMLERNQIEEIKGNEILNSIEEVSKELYER